MFKSFYFKSVNSETLDTLKDLGRDGDQTAGNSNANFPKDVFGYSLNYFNGDMLLLQIITLLLIKQIYQT